MVAVTRPQIKQKCSVVTFLIIRLLHFPCCSLSLRILHIHHIQLFSYSIFHAAPSLRILHLHHIQLLLMSKLQKQHKYFLCCNVNLVNFIHGCLKLVQMLVSSRLPFFFLCRALERRRRNNLPKIVGNCSLWHDL